MRTVLILETWKRGKKTKNYEAKMRYIQTRQHGLCAIGKSRSESFPITELHHMMHNIKMNRRRYPLYIDSVWNLIGVSHDRHMMDPYWGRINLLEADRREAFLRRHPKIAKWMDDPSGKYMV